MRACQSQQDIKIKAATSGALLSTSAKLDRDQRLVAARARHHGSTKGFACFLSHDEKACAAEARMIKQQLQTSLGADIFLGKYHN